MPQTMYKTMKVSLALVLGLSMSFAGFSPANAAYNDINFENDTTLNISDLAINLTVASGSVVESFSVGTGSATFVMGIGSTLTVRSTDFRNLANGIIDTQCAQSYSFVTFNNNSGVQTITITPSTTDLCRTGGWGGVGGGAPAPQPTTDTPATETPATTPAPSTS